MFGLIGKMRAQPGRRGELMEILLAATGSMPGCLSYVVAEDAADADVIWITEGWRTKQATRRRCPCRQSRPRSAGQGR